MIHHEMKLCPACEKEKSVAAFYHRADFPDGYMPRCAACMKAGIKIKGYTKPCASCGTVEVFTKINRDDVLCPECKRIAKNKANERAYLLRKRVKLVPQIDKKVRCLPGAKPSGYAIVHPGFVWMRRSE